ncbi:MAG: hypothetical protein MRZ79_25395 [Bacteroidia bacterium]|nr:hypothetical protein [Bacteroidia bacterium]
METSISTNRLFLVIFLAIASFACSTQDYSEKSLPLGDSRYSYEARKKYASLNLDSLNFDSRPIRVLLTANPEHRLSPVFKVNYYKKSRKPYTGTINFHQKFTSYGEPANQKWHDNFMPGFEAIYGFEMVNISHFNNKILKENKLFPTPVLVQTLYYPTFDKDTLNGKPVIRNYYIVSVYDEDTNGDGMLNKKDLRRIYHFDENGNKTKALVPPNFSVMSSDYDSANDYMYIFARKDENNNGKMEAKEPIQIFWVDLKDPANTGLQYE